MMKAIAAKGGLFFDQGDLETELRSDAGDHQAAGATAEDDEITARHSKPVWGQIA